MSNAIRDAIAHRKGNSLSPESCVLIPTPFWAEGPMHRQGSRTTTAPMHALREIGGGCW